MKANVRTHIIETGAELVHRQGFNNTGIQEILKAAGVPKGSFYFYFENKEDFGLNLIDHFGELFAAVVSEVLADTSQPPLERLRGFFTNFREYFTAQGFTRGCPVGNLAQEMGDLSPAFRQKLDQAIDRMAVPLIELLDEAIARGDVPDGFDSRETAYFAIAAWHGALLRMKVTKSSQPLELFERYLFEKILR